MTKRCIAQTNAGTKDGRRSIKAKKPLTIAKGIQSKALKLSVQCVGRKSYENKDSSNGKIVFAPLNAVENTNQKIQQARTVRNTQKLTLYVNSAGNLTKHTTALRMKQGSVRKNAATIGRHGV